MLKASIIQVISIAFYIIILIIGIKRNFSFKKHFILFMFYFYIVATISITLFPIPVGKLDIQLLKESSFLKNNYIPFKDIIGIIKTQNKTTILKQLFGNILLMVPLGCFVPVIFQKYDNFKRAITIGILSSVTIEFLQFLISFIIGITYRITDIDDVILNTIGFTLGYFLFKKSVFYKFLVQNRLTYTSNKEI
ncbi:VanZ family protein [Ruminiclostridium josui]|uniref:VanZ family protein n=1 Tax=Ruminiclostridium josui TaxID=1499 RepID=UPI000466F044|nr:VanZ family protein [Ruminiclostridium josui]